MLAGPAGRGRLGLADRPLSRRRAGLRTRRVGRRCEASASGGTRTPGLVGTPRPALRRWIRRLPGRRRRSALRFLLAGLGRRVRQPRPPPGVGAAAPVASRRVVRIPGRRVVRIPGWWANRVSTGRGRVGPRATAGRTVDTAGPWPVRRQHGARRTGVGRTSAPAADAGTRRRRLIVLGRPAPVGGFCTGRVPTVRWAVSGRWARGGVRSLPRASTVARPFARLLRVAIPRPELGALLLGRTQVVDPAELLALGLIFGRRCRSATAPSATARLLWSGTGLLGTG
jgi:hypothetical protein